MPLPLLGLAIGGSLLSAGASIFGSLSSGKAQKEAADRQFAFLQESAAKRDALLQGLLAEGIFEFTPVDAVVEARKALDYNREALPTLNKFARDINVNSARSFEEVSRIAFGQAPGGGSAFDEQRSGVNSIIQDQLNGILSAGSRKIVARGAIESGAASLGRQSIRSLYTGYLGITAEQQAQQGVGNYQNLVNTYRSAIPLVTGAQLLPYGGLSSQEAIQNAQFNSSGMLQANVAMADAVLGGADATTKLGAQAFSAQGQGVAAQGAGRAQAISAGASALGSIAGLYAGYQNNPALSSGLQGYKNNMPVYNSFQTGGMAPSQYYVNGGGYNTEVRRAIAYN